MCLYNLNIMVVTKWIQGKKTCNSQIEAAGCGVVLIRFSNRPIRFYCNKRLNGALTISRQQNTREVNRLVDNGKLSISTTSTSPRRLALHGYYHLVSCYVAIAKAYFLQHPTPCKRPSVVVSALLFFGLHVWLLASGKKREEPYSSPRCSLLKRKSHKTTKREEKRGSRHVTTKELPSSYHLSNYTPSADKPTYI